MQCAVCGTIYGIEKHHIIPKILGGQDTTDNFEYLCSACHKKKHLENRSELTKIGLAKAKKSCEPSQSEKAVLRYEATVREYLYDHVDDIEDVSSALDIFYEALDYAKNNRIPYEKIKFKEV